MPQPFLSPALETLRSQINAKWPNRDKRSDGWIGDAAHSKRPSEHNPDWTANGIVRAIDVDKDGVNMDAIVNAFINDPRAWYVIWQGRIRYGVHVTGVPQGWRTYTGANSHNLHAHFSVRKVGNYDSDARSWKFASTTPILNWEEAGKHSLLTPSQLKTVQGNLSRTFPKMISRRLTATGKWGPLTYASIVKYQKYFGLTPDGVPGAKTISHFRSHNIL